MTQKEELLASFDDVLSHKWESLDAALRGVSEEEVHYQHPAYSDEPDELHYPKAGTILWHLVHLAQCYRHYTTLISERPVRTPEPEAPEANALDEGINNFRLFRSELRNVIASLRDGELNEKMSNGDTVALFVRNVVRHDAWHAAQIVLVKRLYKYHVRGNV